MNDVALNPEKLEALTGKVMGDVAGAMGEEIDSLFISGGLARLETKTAQHPDPEALNSYISQHNANPTYTIGQLR